MKITIREASPTLLLEDRINYIIQLSGTILDLGSIQLHHGSLIGLADDDHPQYVKVDGGAIDHGGLIGLTDDDHAQYVKHSLAVAENDVLVGAPTPFGTWVKKTLAQFKTILGLGTAAYTAATDYAVAAKGVTGGDSHDHVGGDGAQIDHGGLAGRDDDDHTQYTKHSLATAVSDFLVASGAGVFVKKTLAEVKTILAHAITHKSGGADAIKLDELAAPTDITTLNASVSAHGLMMKYPGGTTFLRADGTWVAGAAMSQVATPILNVVLDYGADNTGAANASTAIQNAINALPVNGGIVFLPPGIYRLDTGLTLGNLSGVGYSTRHGIELMGAGTGSSRFFNKTTFTGATILRSNTSGAMIGVNGASACIIRDMALDGNGLTSTFIDSNCAPLLRVDNVIGYKWVSDYAVKIRNTSASYYSAGSMQTVFTNVHMRDPYSSPYNNPYNVTANGLDICPNETNFHNISQLAFYGCSFSRGSSGVGLRMGYCDHITFTETFFGRDDGVMNGIGISVEPCTGYAGYPQGITFIGSPIWRGIRVVGTWTAAGNGTFPALIFYPFYTADGQYLPPLDYAGSDTLPNNLVKGMTDNGYEIGVTHLPIQTTAVSGSNITLTAKQRIIRLTNASGATTIQTINLANSETIWQAGGTEITIIPIIASGSISLVTGGNITANYTMVNYRPIRLIYNAYDGWGVSDVSAGGGGISEAPVDGTPYLRQSAGWVTGAGEAWIQATLTPNWVNHSADNDAGTYKSAGYYKDRLGVVHLKGMVKNGTIGTSIFTLPAGYRPTNRLLFAVNANYAFASVDISTTGQVYAQTGATTAFSLEGITFRAG